MAPKDLPETIGRYDVVDRLGYGGMGVVYRARDPRIGRAVAIKLLRVRDEGLRDRFLQEAQSAGNLKHRNIVTIYDFGEHEGQPYIVMELIEGITLSEQIRSNLPLSLPRKLELIEELAMGLEYAHNKGIVHRDVKPANIMIDRDGWLKILDFGIARVGDSGMTRAGVMMGTPNYMSPEQVEGRPVDRRSDIFAVGLVSYEIVSYRQAFPGETLHLVMNAITRSMPTPLEQLCPGLDAVLVAIINRAMQKDPARRYQTLAAMAADVARARAHLGAMGPAADHSDTATWPAPAAPESKRTPRSGGTDREVLSKRRAELIDTHLRVAQQEFDTAGYAAAIDECERAILLDPDEPRAWALLETARRALDSAEVRKCLDEARSCLASGDSEGASASVERARQITPTSDDIREVQSAIDGLKRRHEQEVERRALVAAALVRAETGLASGGFDSAISAAREILIHDPANAEAQELTRRALELSEERRAREQHHRGAQALVDEQRKAFAAGRRVEAIEALQRFTPPHELVTTALSDLRAEFAVIERRAREEDERKRQEQAKAEERRQAQLRWVATQMERAQTFVAARRFLDAIEILQEVQRLHPDASGLADRLNEARQGQAALEAETRRQQQVADHLARAATEFAQGRFAGAVSLVDAALALEPGRADVLALRQRIEEAFDAQRRQQAIDREAEVLVEQARRRFEAGEHAAAMAMLESAPAHPVVAKAYSQLKAKFDEIERKREAERRSREAAIRKKLEGARRAFVRQDFDRALRELDDAARLDPDGPETATLRAQVIAEVEKVRRQKEHERQARAAVTEARRAFAAGNRVSAIASLEQFDPPHSLVSEGLSALRAELATLERRERQEQETARRRAEEERLRKEVSTQQAKARAAAEQEARSAKSEPGRPADEPTIVEPIPAGTLDTLDIFVPAQPTIPAPAEVSPAVRPPLSARWKALVAAAIVIGVSGAGVVWKVVSQSDQRPPGVPATVQTTSIPVTVVTSTVPPSIPSQQADAVLENLVATSRSQLAQGNLAGAARALGSGLSRAPSDPRLGELSRDIIRAASARANDAKRSAERSRGTDRPQYAEGVKHMEMASRLAKSGRVETAVNEYLTAAQLFEQAVQPSVDRPLTSIPITVATTSTPPAPPTTTTAPVVVTPPPPATTTLPSVQPPPVVVTIDEDTARRLLNDYTAAYRSLNVANVRKVFPELTDIARRAIEAEQRDYSYCDYRFTNLQVSGVAARARVEADGVKSCKPKIAVSAITTPTHEIFDLSKLSNGSWVIVRQSTSY